jgi:hypothetical protein
MKEPNHSLEPTAVGQRDAAPDHGQRSARLDITVPAWLSFGR